MARKAKAAQDVFAGFDAAAVDRVLSAMVRAVEAKAAALAKMAVEETGYGVVAHKTVKNLFAARDVYQAIKDIKTIGVIREDRERRIVETAVPVGVILGLTPTTNPTSTAIHNALCAVKAGNAIIFSPHPNAARCTAAAAQIMQDAAAEAGAPDGLVSCLTKVTMQATEQLMRHDDISVIVATGGSAMVKAAYSAGKPAFGVGPGNVPAFIERTADVRQAVRDIIISKTFDNGMICASEQAILADAPVKERVMAELENQGAHFLSAEETAKVSAVVMTPKGGMNSAMVGKTAAEIAERAGIAVPPRTRLLVAPLSGYGPGFPLSYEKLTSLVAFYTVSDWHEACQLSIELLKLGGIGHTFAIHSQDEAVVREFIQKPVFRIVVNTPSAFGAIGYSTGLLPSLTLGCGTWGGSSISENLGPQHLINVKRLAYGIRRVEIPDPALPAAPNAVSAETVASLVRQVLAEMGLR